MNEEERKRVSLVGTQGNGKSTINGIVATALFWQKKEQLIANLRQAALRCGCTEEDGQYRKSTPKDSYKNIPMKYRVKKKEKTEQK